MANAFEATEISFWDQKAMNWQGIMFKIDLDLNEWDIFYRMTEWIKENSPESHLEADHVSLGHIQIYIQMPKTDAIQFRLTF